MTVYTARMLFATAYEKGADGVVGKPRAINGGRNAHVLLSAAQSPHRLSYPARDGVVVQSPQEPVQSGVVRYAPQLQDLAQLAVLAETHFGFSESPVFVTHQAEDGQQLRLGELVFAETTPVGRKNRRGYIHSHASKRQESDFGHRTSCSIRKHLHRSLILMKNQPLCQGCKQSHLKSFRIRTYEKTPGGEGGGASRFLVISLPHYILTSFFLPQTRSAMLPSMRWKKNSPPTRTSTTAAVDARRSGPGGCPCPVSAHRNPSITPAMGFSPYSHRHRCGTSELGYATGEANIQNWIKKGTTYRTSRYSALSADIHSPTPRAVRTASSISTGSQSAAT